MKTVVMNLEGETVEEIKLNPHVFDAPYRPDLLQRLVRWQLARRQAGTHSSKGISDISGTTRKPYKQKGTGRARQGSLRSPQFRGGAVIFGPQPRDHSFKLPKKVRQFALRVALSGKFRLGKLTIVDDLSTNIAKTKELVKKIAHLGWKKPLFVDGPCETTSFLTSIANIPHTDFIPQIGLNVYDILHHDHLILTKQALSALEERLS